MQGRSGVIDGMPATARTRFAQEHRQPRMATPIVAFLMGAMPLRNVFERSSLRQLSLECGRKSRADDEAAKSTVIVTHARISAITSASGTSRHRPSLLIGEGRRRVDAQQVIDRGEDVLGRDRGARAGSLAILSDRPTTRPRATPPPAMTTE